MPEENDMPQRSTRPPYVSLKRGTRPARIYVSDDDDSARKCITLMFQYCYCDYILSEFPDGDKVWDAIKHAPPDLLTTDMRHPGMQVENMLHLLYRKPIRFPIIVFSAALCLPGIRERITSFTMFPVLTIDKPFTVQQFRRSIRRALDLPPRFPYPPRS